MSIFNTNSFTGKRQKVIIQDHEFINDGPAEDIPEFTGTIHSLSGKELKSLDLGRDIEEVKVLITNQELITAQETEKPDIVTFLETGKQYKVVKLQEQQVGIMPHNEYVLESLRREEIETAPI